MIKKMVLVAAVVAVTIFSGCKKDFYSQPDYVGTWNNSGSSTTLLLGINNTYSLSVNSILVSSGNYSAKENVFSLIGKAGYCHDSLPATYGYTYSVATINGTFFRHLSLTAGSDSCSARVAALPGTYTMPNN